MGVTYDRPVEATLIVRLANGEEWKVTNDDLERFGLCRRSDTYYLFRRHLFDILEQAGLVHAALSEARLRPVARLAELAIMYPDRLGQVDSAETDAEVVEIERTLERLAVERGVDPDDGED